MKKSIPLAAFMLAASLPGVSKTIYVNNNPANTTAPCSTAVIPTINAAYVLASAGDTIAVCPGTYQESLDIRKSINITGLVSNDSNAIIIMPNTGVSTTDLGDTSPVSASILVDGVTKVNITNVIVDSTNDSTDLNAEDCTVNNVGIYYRNASGEIGWTVVRNTGLRSGGVLTGCQEGLAVFAQNGAGSQTNLQLTNSSIHDYDKNGVTADGSQTSLTATSNTVTGAGLTSITAQNGIQVSDGAKALINYNTVSDNIYGGTDYAATNILAYDAAEYTDVLNNTLTDSNLNIYFQTYKGYIANNTIAKAVTYDAIDVYGDGNFINENTIFRADNTGVYICGSNNGIHSSVINDVYYGIYSDQADGCTSTSNSATGNKINNVVTKYTPDDGSLGVSAVTPIIAKPLVNQNSAAGSSTHPKVLPKM